MENTEGNLDKVYTDHLCFFYNARIKEQIDKRRSGNTENYLLLLLWLLSFGSSGIPTLGHVEER